MERGPRSGPDICGPGLALDTLAAADLFDLANSIESAGDVIAGFAGIRAARRAANHLVPELTSGPARGAKTRHHGNRPRRSAR